MTGFYMKRNTRLKWAKRIFMRLKEWGSLATRFLLMKIIFFPKSNKNVIYIQKYIYNIYSIIQYYTYTVLYSIYTYMAFTTEGLLEVPIESWPEWNLNRLSYHAMSSTHTQSQLCTATPIATFAQSPISFRLLPSSVTTFILIEIFLR